MKLALLLALVGCGTKPRECPPPVAAAGSATAHARTAHPLASDMVRVPAGEFLMGSPPDVGLEDEHPQRRFHLDEFDLDRTEVTVAAYRRCVAAGSCTEIVCGEASHEPQDRDDHPVVCVTWDQADRFCRWAGKRLPTEAEWEKAARGTDGRVYPWGNDAPTCEHATFVGCGDTARPPGSAVKGTSPYGAVDLAGNVWEWVGDWHHEDYYAIAPARNPPGPWSGKKKVVRGGAYSYSAKNLTTHGRTFDVPTTAYDHVGFRCALGQRPGT